MHNCKLITSLSDLHVYERMKNISKEESEMLGLKNVEKKENKCQENIDHKGRNRRNVVSTCPPVDRKGENEVLRKENIKLKKRV